MRKNEKIGIGVTVLIFLTFFGVSFFISNIKIKETSPPPNTINKTYVATILEINGARYESEIIEKTSVYDFMDKLQKEGKINFIEKYYVGMGELIDSINGIKNNGNQNWIYYVNGKQAEVGVSNYKINKGDIVSWKYEKNN
jgi:hypothetical protein